MLSSIKSKELPSRYLSLIHIFTGPGFDTSLVPDSVLEILQSGGYKLILANSSYKTCLLYTSRCV